MAIPFPATPLPGKPLATSGLDTILGVKGGAIVQLPDVTLTPFQFGAKGDGIADDTAALNAMFAKVRSLVVLSQHARVRIDLSWGIYKITGTGINGTGFQAWNLEICSGVLLGNTTGYAVLDMAGSRGYYMRNVLITGDQNNMPTVPILIGRTTTSFGYCDNCHYDNVTTIGYFSVAAHFEYAQETTKYEHCRFWQYNYDAKIGIFQRSNTYTLASAFQTLITGAASHTNCTYTNCDFRYSGGGNNRATVTAISKATEAIVTANNTFADGDVVIVFLSLGMTQINAIKAVVKNSSSTQFTMTGVDSSAFSTFTGTAFAYRVMVGGGLYMSAMYDYHFLNCYLVALGDDAITLDCNTGDWQSNTFEFSVEGAQDRSVVRVSSGAGSENFAECSWRVKATNARQSFLSTDGAAVLQFFGGRISATSHTVNASLPLVDAANAAQYAFLAGCYIYYPNAAGVTYTAYTSIRGTVSSRDDGKVVAYRNDHLDARNGNYTPAATASGGSITTLGTCSGRVRFLSENLAYVAGSVTITTNGAGSGSILIPFKSGLTAQAAQPQEFACMVNIGGTRTVCVAEIGASGTSFVVRKYDGSYPGDDGAVITFSGLIETA